MAESLGSAVLTLTVDDKQFNAGLGRAKQSAEGAFASIKGPNLGGALGAIGTGLAGAAVAAAAVGAAVAGIGFAATQSAGQIQKLNAAFTGLTGSAEAAAKLRQALFDLSKTTPFKNEEILQSSQRFLAVGVSVENLNGTINRVGALAAQSGQSLERLALIYAQVYAKGRLQGEENLQLLEAGVDLTDELSQVTGLSGKALQDAMSKGQIGIDKFNAALVLATGDMTALELAGKSVDTQFNNIFDNLGQLFGGFATALSPALSAAFKVINDVFESAFPDLDSITQFFAPLTSEAQKFAEVLGESPGVIEVIAGGLRNLGEVVIKNIADGIAFVRSILEKIDQKKFIQGFINAEIAVRRVFLAASALGAQLVKNAELSFRAISNPGQFFKDISKAGGFSQFIEQEYKDVEAKWDAWKNSKPLEFPDVTESADKQAEKIPGSLDDKVSNVDGFDKKKREAAIKRQLIEQETALQLAGIQRRIAATKELSNIEETAGVSILRQSTQNVLGIREGIRSAKDALSQIGAQIDASRLLGDDKSEELFKLVQEQRVAAEEYREKLVEGALALKDAGNELKRNLDSSILELTKVRSDPNGLNRFLDAGQQQQRAAQDFLALLPQFREAQSRFAALTGARAPEFSGSTAGVNESIRSFIDAVNQEDVATQNVVQTQQAIAKTNQELAFINQALAKNVATLAEKRWNVSVNVQGSNGAQIIGDVVGATS